MKKVTLKRNNLDNPVIQAYSRAVQKGYSSHHVLPSSSGWAVKRADAVRATKTFETQKEAIRYGRSVANNNGRDLIIHKKDGRIMR